MEMVLSAEVGFHVGKEKNLHGDEQGNPHDDAEVNQVDALVNQLFGLLEESASVEVTVVSYVEKLIA